MGRCCFNALLYSRYNYSENLLVGKRHRRPKSIWYCYLIFFITCLKPSSIPHYWKLESTSRIWNVKPLKTFDMEKIHRGALSFFFWEIDLSRRPKFWGVDSRRKTVFTWGPNIHESESQTKLFAETLQLFRDVENYFLNFLYFGYNGQQNVFRILFEE